MSILPFLPSIISGAGLLMNALGIGKNKPVEYSAMNQPGAEMNQWLMNYLQGKVGQDRQIAPMNDMQNMGMSLAMNRYGGQPWIPPQAQMMGGGMGPGGPGGRPMPRPRMGAPGGPGPGMPMMGGGPRPMGPIGYGPTGMPMPMGQPPQGPGRRMPFAI